MFENFKKLTIKGGCFENETELTLFYKAAVSIVYGRNGSGKSTIARCIKELTLPDEEKNPDYTVSSDAVITEDLKKNVFVFDEDFVTEQVRFKEDGIQTIVMLGEQGEIDTQIAAKETELTEVKRQMEALNVLRERYDNVGDGMSPQFFYNQLWNALREDDGWTEIDRQIKGNKVKSKLSEDIIKFLAGQDEPAETYEELRDKLMADLSLYLKSSDAQAIEWSSLDRGLPKDLTSLKELLEKKIDAPKLTDREQRLITLLATHPQHTTQETRQLVAEGWEFCPLCLREIKDGDAETIMQTISHILNEEAERYTQQLNNEIERFAKIEQTMPEFPNGLHMEEVNSAKVAQENLNKVLDRIRTLIEERKRRVYEEPLAAITGDILERYADALAEWKLGIDVMSKRVTAFNDTVKAREKLYTKIRNENNLLARKQHAATMVAYMKALEDSENNKKEIGKKKIEQEKIEADIKELRSKKENTKIALDYINDELGYVFYSDRRLKLVAGDDNTYKLKVNGRNVRPNKISVGERNVLALCYFFAKMFKDKTKEEKYKPEYLVIIDDPVSSFDHGNRLGVMTLLRYQFSSLLKGNANSRVLVMSHDLHSVFDLLKIRNELCAKEVKNSKKAFLELENKQLGGKKKDGEYWKLLRHVYEYALVNPDDGGPDPDDTLELGIGNIMRRMMEAFSSFCYARTFEDMLRMEELIKAIPEKKRDYYGNFMCRLALNGESHEEESIYSLETISGFFTKNEKVQTAKSVLLFLLYVNRAHLTSYLEDEIPTIEGWKSEEDSWIKSEVTKVAEEDTDMDK
jgi:wobble nucleotide-excising tRNase